MMTELETATKRLWLAYKAYHEASTRNAGDSSVYATECTNGYLEYLHKCLETYDWDLVLAIENQVRILLGFIECYDRPVKRDKHVLKTRWSL